MLLYVYLYSELINATAHKYITLHLIFCFCRIKGLNDYKIFGHLRVDNTIERLSINFRNSLYSVSGCCVAHKLESKSGSLKLKSKSDSSPPPGRNTFIFAGVWIGPLSFLKGVKSV